MRFLTGIVFLLALSLLVVQGDPSDLSSSDAGYERANTHYSRDSNGRTVWVEKAPDPNTPALDPGLPRFIPKLDPAVILSLESRPGSDHTIYIDASGSTLTDNYWNRDLGKDEIQVLPWSLDADRSRWSYEEMLVLYSSWLGVAEDFAPFDVNVTFKKPQAHALSYEGRKDTKWGSTIILTTDTFSQCNCGGMALVGSFGEGVPVLVFQRDIKSIVEAISHEVGHIMWLDHDGTTSKEYYEGHGTGLESWAPIMGIGYWAEVTQWSRGHFSGSTSADSNANYRQGPDDIKVLSSKSNGNGFGLAKDDIPANRAINLKDRRSVSGTIERSSDIDTFRYAHSGGAIKFEVTRSFMPNLNPELTVRDSAGQVVTRRSQPNKGKVTIEYKELPQGTYTLSVAGVGSATYREYASLGNYSIRASKKSPTQNIEIRKTPVRLSSLDISIRRTASKRIAIKSVAEFVDSQGRPVEGVQVFGRFNYETEQRVSTNSRGIASFSIGNRRGRVDFCITAIASVNHTYDSLNSSFPCVALE